MSSYELSSEQINLLERLHKRTPDRINADRIKAVLLLSKGWEPVEVAKILLYDERTIREYFYTFQREGVDGLLRRSYKGRAPRLSQELQDELSRYVESTAPATVKEVAVYVLEKFGVSFSISGMTKLLKRLNFVYKKTKSAPAKADAEAQREFLANYREIRKDETAQVLFMDGCHPVHNNGVSYAWILKGTEKRIKTNTGRRRLNINGAINIGTLDTHVVYSKSINSESTIDLFKEIEKSYPDAEVITIIADNARYYRSREVTNYLATSRIKILFLPPYSPNLNLIERLWRFMRAKVINNHYYKTFEVFRKACENFFEKINDFSNELKSLLVENFQIIEQIA